MSFANPTQSSKLVRVREKYGSARHSHIFLELKPCAMVYL
jgi:hypothetical protein